MKVWKYIEGYEGLYSVFYSGFVYSLTSGKVLRTFKTKGYHYVRIFKNGKGSNKRLSRVVAQEFLQNPLNLSQVNHKKGNKDLNAGWDLEWSTGEANIEHCINNNLNSHIKLKRTDVARIRTLIAEGKRYTEIGKLFGVSKSCISSINTGRVWKAA